MVAGTGRSGTGFTCHALRAVDIRCGHEQVFGPGNALPGSGPVQWGKFDGDSSWLAVPRLPMLGVTTVLVTRHPLATVRSLLAIGQFTGDRDEDPYNQVIYAHRPQVQRETTEHDRALAMWLMWTQAILPYATGRHQLETLHLPDLVRDLGGGEALADKAGNVDLAEVRRNPNAANTKPAEKRAPVDTPAWEDFRRPLARTAIDLARTLGYDPDEAFG